MRDVETSLANKILSLAQANPSWTKQCHSSEQPLTPSNAQCDITAWFSSQHPDIDKVHQAGQTLTFDIGVIATGIDLETDLTGDLDRDGLRPDLYRIEVTVTPTADLAARFKNLRPVSVRAELNPSSRMETGRITIDVCLATNQVDERMPIATCVGQAYSTKMLPPGSLDMTNASTIQNTCDGPAAQTAGADERDCIAFKCADPFIAPNSGVGCDTMPGWSPPSSWSSSERTFTTVSFMPGSGSISLKSVEDGSTYGPITLENGRAEFTNLPTGEFEVTASVNGGYVPWRSKSVPSSQFVASEPGLNSRAVLVYRPAPTGAVTLRVRSMDITVPGEHMPFEGWPTITTLGEVYDSTIERTVCLVPVPQGRLDDGDVPCITKIRSSTTTEFEFTDVHPGLYAAYLVDPTYMRFYPLGNHGGFIYVPTSGPAVTAHGPVTEPIEYVAPLCAKEKRQGLVDAGFIDPATGEVVTPCSVPDGPPPPGGKNGSAEQ